jgi:hypothetical protein
MFSVHAFRFFTQLADVLPAPPPPSRQRQRYLPPLVILHEGGGSRIPICEIEARVGEHLDSRVDADGSIERHRNRFPSLLRASGVSCRARAESSRYAA